MRSILEVESESLDNVQVRREHFDRLVRYVAGLLCLTRRFFLVGKFSRIFVVKLVYLLDRECVRKVGFPVTRLYYINFFYGPYNPSIVDALEDLVERGLLAHASSIYEYEITSFRSLSKIALEVREELKIGCEKLGVDYECFRKVMLKVMRKVVELDREGTLITYVQSLPEVLKTGLGKVINLEELRRGRTKN